MNKWLLLATAAGAAVYCAYKYFQHNKDKATEQVSKTDKQTTDKESESTLQETRGEQVDSANIDAMAGKEEFNASEFETNELDQTTEQEEIEPKFPDNVQMQDLTLSECLVYYGQRNNTERLKQVTDAAFYLKDKGICAESMTSITSTPISVQMLCDMIKDLNQGLRRNYEKRLLNLEVAMSAKNNHVLKMKVLLPQELHKPAHDNVLLFRMIKPKHIKELRQRINWLTSRFTRQYIKTPKNDYFVLLHGLIQMHADLVKIGSMIPVFTEVATQIETQASVNIVADNEFRFDKKQWIEYLQCNYPPKTVLWLTSKKITRLAT